MGANEGDRTSTGFQRVVRSLLNETVLVELSGNDTTKIGKLVGVQTSFITVAVTDTTGTGGAGARDHTAIHLAYIPFRHIVSVVES